MATIEDVARRIIAENNKQRELHAKRASRLLEITLNGTSDELDEFLDDFTRELTAGPEEDGKVLGKKGDAVATGGAVRSVESETGSGQPTEDTGSGGGLGAEAPVG